MIKCKQEGCSKEALYKSEFCWEHIQDKESYKKLILQPDKEGKINLLGANLKEIDFQGANLKRATFSEANLFRANLSGADLSQSSFVDAILFAANLFEANLFGAELGGTDFVGSYLSRADLRKTDLVGSNLNSAILNETNLRGANLFEADLIEADLTDANLSETCLRGARLMYALLPKANLRNADLRSANLNETDLTGAVLTGAKVWGMSHAGCKTEGIILEYLNFDKEGNDSGIVHLDKEQVDEFFSSQPTIEILLQNKLSLSAIRALVDLIDKINEQNPDWGVELGKITTSGFASELMLKTNKDEILNEVATVIVSGFDKSLEQRLSQSLLAKKENEEIALVLKKLEEIKNPVQQVILIPSGGNVVNIFNKEVEMRDIKAISARGDYYDITVPEGREKLIREIIDELDSPEIDKKVKQAENQLKSFSEEQIKFFEEQFRQIAEKIIKEKENEVGFFDKLKAFALRCSESVPLGVISNAIWYPIQEYLKLKGIM